MIPKVSVIVPAYNADKYMPQLLDILTHQTMASDDMETIIYLDGKTDNSRKIIEKYITENKIKNILILGEDINRGISHARNAAVMAAHGEYIHFMDADDLIPIDFYEKMYAAAKFADADIAACGLRNERIPKDSIYYNQKLILSFAQDRIDFIMPDFHGFSVRYIFRRDFWNINNFMFPENIKIVEDLPLMTMVVCTANRVILVPDVIYEYKFREGSNISHKTPERNQMYIDSINAARAINDKYLAEHGLHRSLQQKFIKKYKLFNVITIATKTYIPKAGFTFIRIFKFIKITIKHKVKYQTRQ